MLSRISTGAVIGMDTELIEVETDIGPGRPMFFMVGLAAREVEESKDRIRAALINTGFELPKDRMTVNLAPAPIRKTGSSYDLPIAVGILSASRQLDADLDNSILAGELSLSGRLRPIRGALSLAIMVKKLGYKNLYIPADNAAEASLIKDVSIFPVKNLQQLVRHLHREKMIQCQPPLDISSPQISYDTDVIDIKGHSIAKRALEIAAAGGHNILFSGPPGSGKTLLARTMPSLLPPLIESEIIEVTQVYSVAGQLSDNISCIVNRPFRHPHHTSSAAALVGGGNIPGPGEISLAHRGVLFLDELPEYPRASLEALRQPLEDGHITISRVSGSLQFPASFILVAAMNPCPCGYATDADKECVCTPFQIINYQKKISGPLLDRIDIHLDVPRLNFDNMNSPTTRESSAVIRQRINLTRQIQLDRFRNSFTITNSEMSSAQIDQFCQLDKAGTELIKDAVNRLNLSPRSYHRLLKISRTIADLANEKNIQPHHLAECLQYRFKID